METKCIATSNQTKYIEYALDTCCKSLPSIQQEYFSYNPVNYKPYRFDLRCPPLCKMGWALVDKVVPSPAQIVESLIYSDSEPIPSYTLGDTTANLTLYYLITALPTKTNWITLMRRVILSRPQ